MTFKHLLRGSCVTGMLAATVFGMNATAQDLASLGNATTTAAAVGYCLARHPYPGPAGATFTADGYEVVSPPGIVGAIRRNYVYQRTQTDKDEGGGNSCAAACAQMGGPRMAGVPLHQRRGDTIFTSGVGDASSQAIFDHDFYTGQKTVVGMWSRGNSYHEHDVAQADFCCCQIR